jgi:hypothetical protein
VGYLIAGAGSAMFLMFGLWDQWWHGLYGFDAVLDSPPHEALFLSISVTMAGSVIVFAAAREQRWGRVGMIVAVPVMLAFSQLTLAPVKDLHGLGDPQIVGSAFLSLLLLITAAACLRRPGTTLAIAAVLAVIQGVLWIYSPWAAHGYADLVGLPLRDYVTSRPVFPSGMPMFLILAAATVELVMWLARSRRWSMRWVPMVAGSLGSVVVAVCVPLQNIVTFGNTKLGGSTLFASTISSAVIGALAGFLGWHVGTMMRDTQASPSPTTEGK